MEKRISAVEAESALREIDASRERMRNVLKSHHGHAYLWLWGIITMFDCFGVEYLGLAAMQVPSLVAMVVGILGSVIITFSRSLRIRVKPDRRFIGIAVMIIVVHLGVIPAIMGWPQDPRAMYTYTLLFWTEIYVVAGIWFNNHLVWCGLLCMVFSLTGLLVFPHIFWVWSGITVGGTLIGSGFVLRYGNR